MVQRDDMKVGIVVQVFRRKTALLESKKEENFKKECTFKPKILSTSIPSPSEETSFLERQARWSFERQAKIKQKLSTQEPKSTY